MVEKNDQNRLYQKDLNNIYYFICAEMRHYISFHKKSSPLPVTVHAEPAHIRGTFPASIVSIIKDYNPLEIEDTTLSASIIPKKACKK